MTSKGRVLWPSLGTLSLRTTSLPPERFLWTVTPADIWWRWVWLLPTSTLLARDGESRSTDAGYLRQHTGEEQDGGGAGRWLDQTSPLRRHPVHLRSGSALQRRKDPSGHYCGQGIRHG